MKKKIYLLILALWSAASFAYGQNVSISKDETGSKLIVDGKPFIVNGMNWDYFPVGTNYSNSLWNQPDDIIRAALDREMPLLKNMGVNTIRQYVGIPSRWVKYIYENYGIYTMLNHSFGRYGLTINGAWIQNIDYSDPATQQMLLSEVKQMAKDYTGTPGVLAFLLGNENDYGLFWAGAETEDVPMEDRKSTIQAGYMYKLFDKAAVEMKKIDASRPISIVNGDLLFLDIIAKDCKDIDIMGVNCYRGASFSDLFEKVKKVYGKPVLLTEFGSDAFNAISQSEDQRSQAEILLKNWQEIYANAAGLSGSGNSLGGFTFQFSDGWWKYGQTSNLEVHDTHASWANGGYLFDYVKGENNMNEEWFGICAKGQTDGRGLYELYPRAAYYLLKKVHSFNPYASGVTSSTENNYFSGISVEDAILSARGDKATLDSEKSKLVRISELRGDLTTYYTGGHFITTPKNKVEGSTSYPSAKGFDNMESYYVGITSNPAENVQADMTVNILGNVAEKPIDEIFYENRGRSRSFTDVNGEQVETNSLDRIRIYKVKFAWDGKLFNMNTFYRSGHYHWGYEGDFFGLYPEANYGPNMDIYNGEAPFGSEIEGKKIFNGLKVAFGPELWWGANPAVLVKYRKNIGKFDVAALVHYDVSQRDKTGSSYAIPAPKNTRASLMVKRNFGHLGIELGGLWSGSTLVGREFQFAEGETGNWTVYTDKIKNSDTFGAKGKITLTGGRVNAYVQGAAMGLVASGGVDNTKTFTGWRLKDSGSGNQTNVLAGFTYQIGHFQLAPNFLWQKPIVGPMPNDVSAPGRLRNILQDPFAVRSNRETTAGEFLLTFDPTPATWMYDWDSDEKEDALFAACIDFTYRHQPTSQDAGIGILASGRDLFAFPGSAPARDLWETNIKMVSRMSTDFGLISNIYFGNAEPTGSDAREIKRFGADLKMIYKTLRINTMAKVNDWGPYDYHRDFNLTYPLQLCLDLSTELFKPKWISLASTRVGIRGTFRTLDKYSPRYAPTYVMGAAGTLVADPNAVGFGLGNEWEIRTYISFSIFK